MPLMRVIYLMNKLEQSNIYVDSDEYMHFVCQMIHSWLH